MPSTSLKYNQTATITIGPGNVTLTNLVASAIKFTIDYQDAHSVWQPITGEITLAANANRTYTPAQLGNHNPVRVGVTAGPDDGRNLLRVDY